MDPLVPTSSVTPNRADFIDLVRLGYDHDRLLRWERGGVDIDDFGDRFGPHVPILYVSTFRICINSISLRLQPVPE